MSKGNCEVVIAVTVSFDTGLSVRLSIKLVSYQAGPLNKQHNSYNYNYEGGYRNNDGARQPAPKPLPMRNNYNAQGNYNGQGNNGRGYNGRQQNYNGGQDFDYYALVVDWPEMICRDLENTGKRCIMPKDVEDWTIKGIWPQKNNGQGIHIFN